MDLTVLEAYCHQLGLAFSQENNEIYVLHACGLEFIKVAMKLA